MRTVLIGAHDAAGGAAIAARRLHAGLRALGQDSLMLVGQKDGPDPHVLVVAPPDPSWSRREAAARRIERWVYGRNRSGISNTRFTLPYPGRDVSRAAAVVASDVVNLHWVGSFLSPENVAALLATGKPVVWTLHDQNPFSGGCHYSAGCLGYERDCRDCPQLRDRSQQLPALVLAAKKRLWRGGMTVVAPSRWLAACARNSALFSGLRVEVIANSLDHQAFRPRDREAVRAELGLRNDCLYLLFSSYARREKRKGFAQLAQALRHCLKQERFAALARGGGVAVLALGPCDAGPAELGIPLHPLGRVTDEARLAQAYAAADLLVIPSEEDNLPNILLEALACATPAVGFAVGGLPDVIADGVNGRLAAPGDAAALGEAILSLAFDNARRRYMGENGRRLIERDFRLQDQARSYLGLFQELRTAPGRLSSAPPPARAAEAIDLNAMFPAFLTPRRRLADAALSAAARGWRGAAKLYGLLRDSGLRGTLRFLWRRLAGRKKVSP
jgi:glycosyltransferase involved in cell wall biosynthesis